MGNCPDCGGTRDDGFPHYCTVMAISTRLPLTTGEGSERDAQTIRGALWHGQGLGGHNNYRAAEEALASLLAENKLLREQLDAARADLDAIADIAAHPAK